MHELLDLQTTTAQIGERDYIVTARGEIDLHSAPQLHAVLDGFTELDNIVLDLREVGFLDSAGLGAITATAKRLRLGGGELFLVSGAREVLAVFRLTGLDQFLTVCATLTAAVEELRVRHLMEPRADGHSPRVDVRQL